MMPNTQQNENSKSIIGQIIDLEDKLKREFQEEATILFSDLVGYTKRGESSSNPQIVVYLRRLENIISPLCKKFNGEIVKTMGDAYMIKFQKADLAVIFAIRLQEELRNYNRDPFNLPPEQISERIGINTGIVIRNDKNDYFGEVVNVASRLQGAANPNGILIGEATYNAVSQKNQRYFIKILSSIPIKNHTPVTAYVYSTEGTIPEGLKFEDEAIEEEGITCLLKIQEALAAEESVEPDPFRWGPLYWQDIEGLYRRGECDQIINKLEEARVVLIEGYSASGKSSLVSRIGYELVEKRGETVYYGNLTTQIGLNTRPEELVQDLVRESMQIRNKTYLILEDLHQAFQEMGRLNPLTSNPCIRLILTSRPLARYEIKSYRGREQGGMPRSFQWIASQNRLELKTDETLVEAIIREKGLPRKDVTSVLKIIGEEEPNLLLLSLLIQVARRTEKMVDQVTRGEIISLVRAHLEEIRERLSVPSNEFGKIMGMISTLSEYEIPLETDFIRSQLPSTDTKLLLEALKREREILTLQGKTLDQEYLILLHARLASLYQEVCFSREEREKLLKDYLLSGEFFGRLTRKIRWENKELLRDLIKSYREELISRDLSTASLEGIGDLIGGISWASKEVAKAIAERHQETLKARDLSTAPLEETGDFLWEISWTSEEVARTIAEKHQETLKYRFSTAPLKEIGDFLLKISWASEELLQAIIKRADEKLLLRRKRY